MQLLKATPYHKAWTHTVLGIFLPFHLLTGISGNKDLESVTKEMCYCDTDFLSYLNITTDAQVKNELSFSFDWTGIRAHKQIEGLVCCLAQVIALVQPRGKVLLIIVFLFG